MMQPYTHKEGAAKGAGMGKVQGDILLIANYMQIIMRSLK